MRLLSLYIFSVLFFIVSIMGGYSQCMMAPLSLSKRVVNASTIIQGRVIQSTPYLSSGNRIFTSNLVAVKAYLKGHSSRKTIVVISEGGVLENRAELVQPALEMDADHEMTLLLTGDNTSIDNKDFRQMYPDIPQMCAYGCSQGKFTYQDGLYHDLLSEAPLSEVALFKKINQISGLHALTPDGYTYIARSYFLKPKITTGSSNARITSISTASPNPGIGGTINVADQITISGSGFGATVGMVEYSNADNGGATLIQSPVPTTDIISWSDAQIAMKVPRQAGTGAITVNGTFTIPYTVNYSHLEINNIFSGFASATRQRFYLVNQSGSGGYIFQLNTTFAANALAVAAFERALVTWRCNTFINYSVSATTTSNAVAANDGINTVFYDPTLPAGVLGQAVSTYLAISNGSCTMQNTEWYTSDIDIRFQDPPLAGYTWNYGPGASIAAGTTYDFESVSLHELGHAHGLGHIIATGKVMNYALFNGSDVRTLDATDIAGGNAKLAYSAVAANYCIKYPSGVIGPMILLNAGSCALPLSLQAFAGNRVNAEKNQLTWSTSDEVNVKGFELSRSYDAANFETIAFIDGKGSSSSSQQYEYMDYLSSPQKLVYYKLTEVDLNNQKTAFQIVVLKESESTVVSSGYFEPGDKIIYTQLSSPVAGDMEWVLYNNAGQIVAKDKIAAGSAQIAHHVYALSTGIYNYIISGNGIQLRGKLAVQQVW